MSIWEAEHSLKNSSEGFYDPIAVDISLAEQNGYKFIKHLKAEFRTVKVYGTYCSAFCGICLHNLPNFSSLCYMFLTLPLLYNDCVILGL